MSAPTLCLGRQLPPPYPIATADILRCSRVTQLLERLNRVVEEGNLFDPVRPSLGSELEALRQRLEALSSGPGTWESHSARPAGVPCMGMAWGVVSKCCCHWKPASSLWGTVCLWPWDLVSVPHCPLPVCLRQTQCSAAGSACSLSGTS